MNSLNNHDPLWGPLVIRRAVAADRPALRELAALDSGRPLTDAVLIGELRGKPVAALDLSDGAVVADPFVTTAEVVELLRLRAKQVELKPSRPRAPVGSSPRATAMRLSVTGRQVISGGR